MATVFKRDFKYYELSQPTYAKDGTAKVMPVKSKIVRGTIQPITGNEAIVLNIANRDTGNVKIYSSERLGCREQNGSGLFYMNFCGRWYEIVQELCFQNLQKICHYKYIASEVPKAQIPKELGSL